MGHMIPTLSPIGSPYRSRFISFNRSRLKPSPFIKTRFLYSSKSSRSACSFAVLVTIPLPLLFPQVSSCSLLSDSSTVGSYWMDVENVALAWWNSGLVIALSMIVDSRGSTFVLTNGTFIALVRPLTAICSPFTAICSPFTAICSPFTAICSPFTAICSSFTAICSLYFELTLLGVALLQIGQRFLSSFTVPVILVRRGFHSPHLSFTELIILPNTSLVFSVIVIGRLVIKHVLLDAEARIVVQDGSRSAFVDGLTSEALFPPPCGFGKDYRVEDVCSSALVAEALALRIIVEQLAEPPTRFTTDSIEVLSDSQGLISSIKTKASSKELKAILHDITYVSDSLKSLSFHFVPRLRNVVADSIAKSALVAANSSSFNGV